jgi:hypothetical protein
MPYDAVARQYIAAAICLLTVSVGVVFQFRGSASARVGVLPEYRASVMNSLAPNPSSNPVHSLVIAFEHELVSDWGDVQGRIANLLSYSSVIASLTVNFPSQWIAGLGLYCASLVVVAFAGWRGITQMVGKMNRQQELFDRVDLDLADREGVLRDFSQRHRAFRFWKRLSLIGKIVIIIREADYTAKWFVRKDR